MILGVQPHSFEAQFRGIHQLLAPYYSTPREVPLGWAADGLRERIQFLLLPEAGT